MASRYLGRAALVRKVLWCLASLSPPYGWQIEGKVTCREGPAVGLIPDLTSRSTATRFKWKRTLGDAGTTHAAVCRA